ncbi:MAG: alanine dehydrogenase [Cyanobacteriota bacterium]
MLIGVPKEIKDNEYRVSLTPGGARALVNAGHTVYVQSTAGDGSSFSDQEYEAMGAKILPTAKEVFEKSEMIIKVKEPLKAEYELLRKDHILFTYLHLAASKELTDALVKIGLVGIAYETIQLPNGSLPLLTPMSEIAGRMAVQVGAQYLEKRNGGRGILLGGIPGVQPANVVIIGGGVTGTQAAKVALGMGANVTILDNNLDRLRYLSDILEGRFITLASNYEAVETASMSADLLIGAVLIPGAKAPVIVNRDMVSKMKKGSVIVDISVDQGGCVETIKATTHSDPIYTVDGVIHYGVANIPGAVPRSSTLGLTNATLPYILQVANKGYKKAMEDNKDLAKGLNVEGGKILLDVVADTFK